MTKKTKFPLIMDGDKRVRSVDELREHFSTARVLAYVSNGKLATWLHDRNAHDLAEAVESLEQSDSELPRKVMELFGLTYDERAAAHLQEDLERNRRLDRLKEFTEDAVILEAVDFVAFNQAELDGLLIEGKTTVYLCGERFNIPLDKGGVRYVGVNNPVAVIASETVVDLAQAGIALEGVRFNDEYQAAVDAAKKPKYSCAICKLGGHIGSSYAIIYDEKGKKTRYIGDENTNHCRAIAANNTTLFYCCNTGSNKNWRSWKLKKLSLYTLKEEQIYEWDHLDPFYAVANEKWLVISDTNQFQVIRLEDMTVRICPFDSYSYNDFIVIGDYLFISRQRSPLQRIDLNDFEESKQILPISGYSICGGLMTDDNLVISLWTRYSGDPMWLNVMHVDGNTITSKNMGNTHAEHSVYYGGFVYYTKRDFGKIRVRKINIKTFDDTEIDVIFDSKYSSSAHLFIWNEKLYLDGQGKAIWEYNLTD